MATQVFAGAVNLTRSDLEPAQGSYKLDTLLAGGNVDLTNTATSPTVNANTGVAYIGRAIQCDVAGTVTFAMADGSIDTWTVNAGQQYPALIAYVFQSGTNATGIHILT